MKEPGERRSYEPVADIATGGMGRVELVVRREGSFARIYAMKRLHAELASDPDVRAMFLEEARIAGLIRHPNVVPVLDVGEDEFGPYLVMDYVEGVAAYRPLVAAIKSDTLLSIAFCVEVARQTAHGLSAAHDLVGAGGRHLNVIHRDISPQNILLGFDGLVRVTDFGVAKVLDHRPHDAALIIGKMGYMSPEQIERRPLDPRSDLFSLGVVLYELLLCDRLYGGSQDEVFERVCRGPVPDICAVRPEVPPELAALLSELLAKTPDARPPSASAVAERLDAIGAALHKGGHDPDLRATLLRSFAKERAQQQAMVVAALEKTRAEVSLLEGEAGAGDSDGSGARRSSDALDATVNLSTPGRRARAQDENEREGETRALALEESDESREPATVREMHPRPTTPHRPARRAPLWLLAGAVLAVAILGSAVVIAWWTGDGSEDDEIAASRPPVACETSTACRMTEGAATFCDVATRVCRSVVSPTCPALFPANAAGVRNAIVFGTIFDRSSPNQLARVHAAELAVEGVNRGGGIDGRTVVLLHCDASVGATVAADELVRAGVPAIIGPSTSTDVEAVFTAHARDGALLISPSATATQLTGIDTHTPGLLWRTTPPDSLQAAVILSDLLEEPRAASVAIVRRANDVYAQSLSVILQEAATGAGLRVDASQAFTDVDAVPRVARETITTGPDAVVFLSSRIADAAASLDATSALEAYADTRIYFADAAANDDLFSLATHPAPRLDGVRATRPATPSTIITSEFVSDYMAAYGGQDPLQFSFTAHTYDATVLVMLGAAYALANGGELTGARIASGIALMSAGTEEHRLLAANIRATIAALREPHPNVDVVGASGPLDFDPETEELTTATYEVLQVWGDPPHFEVVRSVDVPPPTPPR